MKSVLYLLELYKFHPVLQFPIDGMHLKNVITKHLMGCCSGCRYVNYPKRGTITAAQRAAIAAENESIKAFQMKARDRRTVNARWAKLDAPSSVYVRSRLPFKESKRKRRRADVREPDPLETLRGAKNAKCIDRLLICELAPFLFKDIIIKNRVCSRIFRKLLRALAVVGEDGMAAYTAPVLSKLLIDFDRHFPESLRQGVFHLAIHYAYECQLWGGAKNTHAFGYESAYGVLSRHVKNRRSPEANLIASQGQIMLCSALYNDEVQHCLDSMNLGHLSESFGQASLSSRHCYLTGSGTILLKQSLKILKKQVKHSPNLHINRRSIVRARSYKSANCHGRVFVVKNKLLDEKTRRREIQSYSVLKWDNGSTVRTEHRSFLIQVARISGFYRVYCKDPDDSDNLLEHDLVLTKVYKARRMKHDILAPYTVMKDTVCEILVPVTSLHLQPTIAVIPGTADAAIWGIH